MAKTKTRKGGGPDDPNRPRKPEEIFLEPFDEALSRRYLAYALSTITARALPDIRDGLKPVHRRILYAMRQMRLNPKGGFKKSAKVVGEVMGNYHPHGDQAIYDAMVRLVQDFSVRVPLIDGQGNFGNIDGDNAAAMRYTEARLTDASGQLVSHATAAFVVQQRRGLLHGVAGAELRLLRHAGEGHPEARAEESRRRGEEPPVRALRHAAAGAAPPGPGYRQRVAAARHHCQA